VRKEYRPIIIERGGSSALWWLLVGGALGAGLALLFAPQSGDRTRRVVGRKLGKLRDAADEAFEDLRDALSPEERVHRSLANSKAEQEEEIAAPGTPSVADDGAVRHERSERGRSGKASARHELEQRLAEARARRQRALADEDEEPVA
jgi:gas vesicle protein